MSLLKPRDIANVQFRTAWRGYNEADVDEFVQKMVRAYETLYHEYQKLQEEYGPAAGAAGGVFADRGAD